LIITSSFVESHNSNSWRNFTYTSSQVRDVIVLYLVLLVDCAIIFFPIVKTQ